MPSRHNRCSWAESHPLLQIYHDTEWGVPLTDDQKLFEFLILDGAQAGLSWLTILKKRPAYQEAYEQFDIETVARYGKRKINALLKNAGIVRNRLKIESSIRNAQEVLKLQEEFGSFAAYLWAYANNQPIQNRFSKMSDLPAHTPLSDQMSKDLKKRGFNFAGSTILYAYLQSMGLVNDHPMSCFRHAPIARLGCKPLILKT